MLYASWFIKWTFECFTMGRRTLRCESSKGKQISIRSCQRRQNCKRKTLRGEWSEGGNALRRTAWFVVVLLSNALERKFILVWCWNLRPFAAQPAHHPHGRRPLERAFLAAARWALGTTTRDKQWSLASDGPQVPSSTPCRMGTHTLYKAGKHLVVASMPRLLYITA